ncbi:MAG: putative metal chaperone YciC [Actinomycetota bacterium]|jgi:G3E family GTPase
MGESVSSIATYVIAGFLGAGKTTLINEILRDSDEPIAVVVNDFGSINIDASLIATQTDDVIELTNGCICCSVGESLADALYAILDRENQPSAIVIEASGVADPASVSAYTHLHGLHNAGTIVLVDAVHARAQHDNARVHRTFCQQVRSADLVALTKTDLTMQPERDEIAQLVQEISPDTPLIGSTPEVLSQVVLSPRLSPPTSAQHDSFHTTVIAATTYPDESALREELSRLPQHTVRAKGVVALDNGEKRLVQQVGHHLAITPTTSEVTGIVVIYTD